MPLLQRKDIESLSPVFRGRVGNAFAGLLMKILSLDDFCALYDSLENLEGPDFAAAVLKKTGTVVRGGISGMDQCVDFRSSLSEILPEGPFITVSNHPYGGVDGIVLADILGHIRPDYKIMVNKILGMLKAMDSCFITVTPTGKQRTSPTADSLSGIRSAMEHLRSGHPLGIFPSGAVSDLKLVRDGLCTGTEGLGWKNSHVRDRQWQEPVLRLIKRAGVPVVPIRFFDGNSLWYYMLGLVSWKVRVTRLPKEVINKRGKLFRMGIGPAISAEELAECPDTESAGKLLRSAVYDMEMPELFVVQ